MKKYTLTRKAEQDILGIWDYSVRKWGADQAEKYLNGLEERFEQISDSPDAIGVNRELLKPGYMSSLYEKHVIFFIKIS